MATNSFIGFWCFGNNDAASIKDFSTKEHHSTAATDITVVAGETVGYAGQFNGTTSLVNMGDVGEADAVGGLTLFGRINPEDFAAARPIIAKVANYSLSLDTSGAVVFTIYFGSGTKTLTSTSVLTANAYASVVAVYDGAEMAIYIDGVKDVTTLAATGNTPATADNLYLGYDGTNYFYGEIECAGGYIRGINTDEISFLSVYTNGTPRLTLGDDPSVGDLLCKDVVDNIFGPAEVVTWVDTTDGLYYTIPVSGATFSPDTIVAQCGNIYNTANQTIVVATNNKVLMQNGVTTVAGITDSAKTVWGYDFSSPTAVILPLASGKTFRGNASNMAVASTFSIADTFASGSIVYSNGANNLAALAVGASGTILIGGAAPSYSSSPVISTSVTTPLSIGGSAANSTKIIRSTSGVGATDAIILQVGNNGATEAMRVINSGFVGINIAIPSTQLQVATTSTSSIRGVSSSQHSAGVSAAQFIGLKSRGTSSVPTIITSGDGLNSIRAGGYDGSNYIISGELAWESTGTVALTRIPSLAKFYTATDAAPSVLTEAWRVDELQRFIVGGNAAFTTGVSASHIFQVRKSVNATVGQIIINENTGTSAYTQLLMMNSSGSSSQTAFGVVGVNTPSSGEFVQNEGYLRTTTTGLNIAAKNATGLIKFWTGATPTERWRISSGGNLSNTVADGTAYLHLKAGTATASTAPIKLTEGTIMTTAESGAHEYNGNHYLSNATLRFPLGGCLFDYSSDISVGGAETDIYSSTLAANTFNKNGDKVCASWSGVYVNSVSHELKVYFAGTNIYDSGLLPYSAGGWNVVAELIRVSSTVVRYSVRLTNSDSLQAFITCSVGELTGLTLTGTNILKITAYTDGSAGDLVGKMGTVAFAPGV